MNLDEGILFHGYEAVYQGNVFSHTISFTNNGNATPTVIWSSSNTGVVTVDPQTGEIRAKQPGNATVTVSIPCNGRFASLPIEVIPAFCLYPDPSGTVNKGQTFEIRKICPAYSDETEKRVGDPSVLEYTNTCVKTVGAGTTSFTVSARPTSEDYEPIDVTYIFSVRGVRLVDESGKVLSAGEGLYPGENKIFYAEGHNMDGYCEINLCANTEELSITCCCDNDPYKFMVSASNSLIDVENAKLILTGEGRDYYDRTVYDFPVKGVVGPDVYIISNSGNGLFMSYPKTSTIGGTGYLADHVVTEYPVFENSCYIWNLEKMLQNTYRLKNKGKYLTYNSNNTFTLETIPTGNSVFSIQRILSDEESVFRIVHTASNTSLSVNETVYPDDVKLDQNNAFQNWKIIKKGKVLIGADKYDTFIKNNNSSNFLQKANISFVAHYISYGDFTEEEMEMLDSLGISFVSLFEHYKLDVLEAEVNDSKSSTDPYKSFNEIAQDYAREAITKAENIRQPEKTVIYFACEFDGSPAGTTKQAMTFDYMNEICSIFMDRQENPNEYLVGFYGTGDLYAAVSSLPITHYMLPGIGSYPEFTQYNKSSYYHIKQMMPIDPVTGTKYSGLIGIDPDISYRSLDEIGAWQYSPPTA